MKTVVARWKEAWADHWDIGLPSPEERNEAMLTAATSEGTRPLPPEQQAEFEAAFKAENEFLHALRDAIGELGDRANRAWAKAEDLEPEHLYWRDSLPLSMAGRDFRFPFVIADDDVRSSNEFQGSAEAKGLRELALRDERARGYWAYMAAITALPEGATQAWWQDREPGESTALIASVASSVDKGELKQEFAKWVAAPRPGAAIIEYLHSQATANP
jgi:hypothetical protein